MKKIWIIGIVCLLVVALAVGLWLGLGNKTPESPENPETTEATGGETTPTWESADSAYEGMATVMFMDGQTLVSAQKVAMGALPEVPAVASTDAGMVFYSWDKEILPVEGDIVYNAVYEEIGDEENVFVLDTLYLNGVSDGVMTLSLKGQVKLSVADVQIKYDPTVLRVEAIENADPSIKYNILPEEGRIKISILLQDNLEASMDCFNLRFSFADPAVKTAELSVIIDDAAALSGSELTDVAAASVSGKIIRVG